MRKMYKLWLALCVLSCCLVLLARADGQHDDDDDDLPPLKEKECLSCDWISPEMSATLFELSAHVQSHCKTPDEVRAMKKDGLHENVQFLLRELEGFANSDQCSLDQVEKLITLEIRLEEGDKFPVDVDSNYKTKILSLYMQQIHLRLVDVCRQEALRKASEWQADKGLQRTRQELIKFSDYLKAELARHKAEYRKSLPLWFNGLMWMESDESDKKKPEFEHGTDLMHRGKIILERVSLFDMIKPTAGRYFGKKPLCLKTLAGLQASAAGMEKTLEPLSLLVKYDWQEFVHNSIPGREKRARKQFETMRPSQEKFVKSNKLVGDFLALHHLLKETLQRRDDLCIVK